MTAGMKAIEVNGTIDEQQELHLDERLPVSGPARVRVIILMPDDSDIDDSDIDEREWLRAASTNPAFDFLNDPAEDVYTLDDGKPFVDPG